MITSILDHNQNQWIQADLMKPHRIESVTTQGGPSINYYWVKSYYFQYSQDGITWEEISRLFVGNRDKDTKMANPMPDNIEARFIRLRPNSWDTRISMRYDVKGCAVQGRMSLHILIFKMLSFLLQLGKILNGYFLLFKVSHRHAI